MSKTRFTALALILPGLHLLFVLWLVRSGITYPFILKFHALFPALFAVAFIKRMEYCGSFGSFGSGRVRLLLLALLLSCFAATLYPPLFLCELFCYALAARHGIRADCD